MPELGTGAHPAACGVSVASGGDFPTLAFLLSFSSSTQDAPSSAYLPGQVSTFSHWTSACCSVQNLCRFAASASLLLIVGGGNSSRDSRQNLGRRPSKQVRMGKKDRGWAHRSVPELPLERQTGLSGQLSPGAWGRDVPSSEQTEAGCTAWSRPRTSSSSLPWLQGLLWSEGRPSRRLRERRALRRQVVWGPLPCGGLC